MSFVTIVKSIEALPPLSDITIKIQEMYSRRDEIEITKLVSLIESDAPLAANILKIANAPLHGFSSRISSVSQAVTLFGIMRIYAFIINSEIDENMKANTEVYHLSNEKFNDMCHLQAELMMQWYRKINFKDAQFLSSLALIMESGKLILAAEITNSSYKDEFTNGLIHSKNVEKYEKEFVGVTSYYLSSLLFKHWNLEPLYSEILSSLEMDEELGQQLRRYVEIINIVKIAVNTREFLTKHSVLEACKDVKKIGIEIEPFVESAIKIKKSYIQVLKLRQKK